MECVYCYFNCFFYSNLFHKRFPDSQLVVNVTSEKDDFISTFATADDGDGKIVKWIDFWHGQKIAGRL